MTWSYSPTSLATNPFMQVRRLIGDVISSDQQIADEEITFALTQRSSIYGAAAECCRYIAAQYSRQADTVTGELKENFSNRARAYSAMAMQMETLSTSRGGAVPYAGGISVSDKINQEANLDRVTPQFAIGMDDNFLPTGVVGNETLTGGGRS